MSVRRKAHADLFPRGSRILDLGGLRAVGCVANPRHNGCGVFGKPGVAAPPKPWRVSSGGLIGASQGKICKLASNPSQFAQIPLISP
jgi:hypothetical protein